jgi:hypothetical protein
MTNYEDIQQALVDKLGVLAATNTFDAYEVDVPIGTSRPYDARATLPYVLIDFGGKGAQSVGDQGITGTRDNMKWSSVVFEVVANNPATVRTLLRIVRDAFEGYSPDPRWGQLVERVASPLYDRQPSMGGELYPARYSRTIAYVVDVDA